MFSVTIGLIGIGIMLLLMAFRMPIAIALALPGFVGALVIMGPQAAFTGLGTIPFSHCHSYTLTTIPMFILMGQLIFVAGISSDIFNTFDKWLRQLRGGLAMATIGACGIFAAACGSSLASSATMGSVALPEMEELKYDRKLALGTIAAGGTLGILIPPSTAFIVYGLLSEQSIGKLFIAGIVPGILLALLFMLTINVQSRFRQDIAPSAAAITWKQRFISLKGLWVVFILFIVVIGGIYIGVFTPTEAAGVGAFGAFIIAVFRKRLTWQGLLDSLTSTLHTTCMIFAIIIGAMIFNYFLAVTGLPMHLADFVMSLSVPKIGILCVILMVYLILGMFMDAMAMVIITIPIFLPAIQSMGFDLIWSGVVLVIVIEMAMITPPVGMNVYVLSGVAKHVPLEEIFQGVLIFVVPMLILMILLLVFPELALFLPNMMK
ncbi:MAG: TRAP transporter large permease [Thermodesulfobacteriota bacterium]|nr:TRAP transporter large permease [Thermodesulfobacteriota bacterium]